MSLYVNFFDLGYLDKVELKFVVIQARYNNQWIFVRHKKRKTLEIPGGHIEKNESPGEAAKRELFEETGATKFSLNPICIYSVSREGEKESYGVLYYSEVDLLGDLPNYEIDEVKLFDDLPDNLTYEQIQPLLFKKVIDEIYGGN